MTEQKTILRYLFPNTKHKNTSSGQIAKVLDELIEAEAELIKNDRNAFLIEMIDVLHSSAGVLYKSEYNYTDKEISDAIIYVQTKNKKRGYYEKE